MDNVIVGEEKRESKHYLNVYESSGRKLYYEVLTLTEDQAVKKLHSLMVKYADEIATVYGTVTNEQNVKVYDELVSKKLGTATNVDTEQPAPEAPVEEPIPAIEEPIAPIEEAPATETPVAPAPVPEVK